jgi:MFS family permease
VRGALADGASRRFFAAHAQSSLGSGLAHVALPLLAYDLTGSAWAVTAVLVPDLLPAILFGPLLGALVDKVGWRACAIAADVLRGVAFTILAVTDSMVAMVLAAALAGTGVALFTPAALAGLGRLAGEERRPAALGLFGALDDIGLTAGPALAALLLAFIPAAGLLAANAVTFAISALLLVGLPRDAPRTGEMPSLWRSVSEGMRDLRGRADVRVLLLSSAAAVMCVGVTNVGEVVLARDVLGVGGTGLGALIAAAGLGTVLGSLAARFGSPWQWRRAYVIGLMCMAGDLFVCALAPSLWVLLPVFVIGGFGNGIALVHDRLLLAHAVPATLHGRLFGLHKTLVSAAFALSFLAAGGVIAVGGVQLMFFCAGAGLLSVIALVAPRLRSTWPAPAPLPLTA